MEWLPIESAPKDGTPILAYAPEGRYDDIRGLRFPLFAVVRWPVEHPRHAAPDLQDNHTLWEGYYDGIGPFDGPVTHWMPLPDPPADWVP